MVRIFPLFFLCVARLPWRHCEIETIFYSERLIANNSKDAQKQISSNFISQTVNNHKRFLRRKKRLSTFTIRLRIHGRNIHSENKPFRNTFAMYTLSNRLFFFFFFFGWRGAAEMFFWRRRHKKISAETAELFSCLSHVSQTLSFLSCSEVYSLFIISLEAKQFHLDGQCAQWRNFIN